MLQNCFNSLQYIRFYLFHKYRFRIGMCAVAKQNVHLKVDAVTKIPRAYEIGVLNI